MLTLFTFEARAATSPPLRGLWAELAPGPDERADEPAMFPVEASDLPLSLIRALEREDPVKRDDLVRDLEGLASGCRAALRRWGAITVIGL